MDGLAYLEGRAKIDQFLVLTFQTDMALTRYMIQKGSVSIDGVSLTLNRIESQRFEVSIIPHTAMLTTIGRKDVGDAYNIETDLIGKYVERFLEPGNTPPAAKGGGVDLDLLTKSGFLKS